MSRRLVFLALTFFILFTWMRPAGAVEDAQSGPALIQETMELLETHHLSHPDPAKLTDGAIQGMLDSLDDPYAEYFSAEELQGFADSLNGDLVGVGIEIRAGEQYPFVVDVIPGTPAAKGGIAAGDLIVAVNGESTEDLPLAEVVTRIRGVLDSAVTLTLRRGAQEFDLILHRAAIHVPLVEQDMLDGGTGYIKIVSFGTRTAEEFDAAMARLKADGMRSLIVDLRFNGGGYVLEAIDILDNFIADDSLAFIIDDGLGHQDEIHTQGKPAFKDLPVVVLVNGLTASASEILAGALQDHGKATLVGDTTYGKGVMQAVIPLSTGGALKLTVSRYLTPAGRDIDIVGLTPDHFVLVHDLQKEIAWQLLHPEDDPDLGFVPGSGKAALNSRELDVSIDFLQLGNERYLPLRPVLEAMLYQVAWQDGVIKIFSGREEILTLNTFNSRWNIQPGAFIEQGISYLPEKILPQLNIDINKEGNKIVLTRRLF
ncbi:S41 family peptidase [Desulfoscipio geothermicus]|nr:S41 family peptidase [Desulfoscipio geothermicus]